MPFEETTKPRKTSLSWAKTHLKRFAYSFSLLKMRSTSLTSLLEKRPSVVHQKRTSMAHGPCATEDEPLNSLFCGARPMRHRISLLCGAPRLGAPQNKEHYSVAHQAQVRHRIRNFELKKKAPRSRSRSWPPEFRWNFFRLFF